MGSMPNWCTNRLEVYGPAEELSRFTAESEVDEQIDFNLLVPVPDNVAGQEGEVVWRKKNWGCQCSAIVSNQEILRGPDQITYTFDTAWTPPIKWVDTVSAMYPKLSFDLAYHELAGFFAGSICFRDGDLYSIEEYTDDTEVIEFMETMFQYDMEEFLEANRP